MIFRLVAKERWGMLEVNRIHCMDCLEGMKQLADNSADCCVTDPPYGQRFMGKVWDSQIPSIEVWREVRRVLKPGAHLLAACGTRTQHRMAVNIEDAGFEIREIVCWHYGQGFPKSLDIGKAIDKEAGATRISPGPITENAKKWDGWGTALKPATEFWTLARKPIEEKTIAQNVLKYGTGGLNIDACRIPGGDAQGGEYTVKRLKPGATLNKTGGVWRLAEKDAQLYWGVMKAGRFPANLILDEFMAAEMDGQTGILESGKPMGIRKAQNKIFGQYAPGQEVTGYGDSGGASRFFYVAKADAEERGSGNDHSTVKPLTLMQYLIKLVCPIEPGRIVLEPFAGSGSTCIAARLLGIDFMAFELDARHVAIAEQRLRNELGLFYET